MEKGTNIKNKVVSEDVETKSEEQSVELRTFTFPREGIVVEAEDIDKAIAKKDLLLSNDKK